MLSQTQLEQSQSEHSSSSTVISTLNGHLHLHRHVELERSSSVGNETTTEKVEQDVDIDLSVSPDGCEQKLVRTEHTSTTVTKTSAEIHPFDLLVEGQSYNVHDFTGSCPNAALPLRAMAGGQDPVWKHSACTLKVLDQDEKKCTKRIQLDATVAAGNNITVGLADNYSVELTLKKDVTGKITCTSAKGVAGKLAFPSGFLPALNASSAVANVGSALVSGVSSIFSRWGSAPAAQATPAAAAPVLGWNDVAAYGTPTNIEQNIKVILQPKGNGNFELLVNINPNDPKALVLDGMPAKLLGVSQTFGVASPAELKGFIDLLHPIAEPAALLK